MPVTAIAVPLLENPRTEPLPADVFEVLVEELVAALMADFQGNSTATVDSLTGMNHGN
jgi:hypothetical protein